LIRVGVALHDPLPARPSAIDDLAKIRVIDERVVRLVNDEGRMPLLNRSVERGCTDANAQERTPDLSTFPKSLSLLRRPVWAVESDQSYLSNFSFRTGTPVNLGTGEASLGEDSRRGSRFGERTTLSCATRRLARALGGWSRNGRRKRALRLLRL